MSEARSMRNQNKTIQNTDWVKGLTQKWGKMLEGIQDPHRRGVTAILMENQYDHLANVSEETISTNVGPYQKFIFPWLRKVFPNLIANELVSVQPMTGPQSTVFYFDWKYGDTKGGVQAGQKLIESFSKAYSSSFIDYEVKCAAGTLANAQNKLTDATNAALRVPFQWIPVQPYKTNVGTPSSWQVVVTFKTAAGSTCTAGDDGTGVLRLLSGTVNAVVVGAQVGTINYTTGAWTLDISAGNSEFDEAEAITAKYWMVQEKVGFTANAKNPSLYFDVSTASVEATTSRLTARWSEESIEDLRNLQGEDAERILMEGMAQQIGLEIDRTIIGDLIDNAKYSASFSFANGLLWDTTGTVFGPGGGGSNTYQMSELDAIRSLVTLIEAMGSKIHKGSGRAPANFLVVGPAIGAMLSQLRNAFVPTQVALERGSSYTGTSADYGIMNIGTLLGKYRVFQDPFQTESQILVGLKGGSFLDAGYAFCPYVPVTATSTLQDPETFTNSKGLRTRYGKKMLRPEYYGTITVDGLPAITEI